jgi:alginate O-acetyltransferase complex protein AlgI
MVFSSVTFLFFFLPITLVIFFFLRNRPMARNVYLLIASFVFYFWDEKIYTLLIVLYIVMNYYFGILLARAGERRKMILIISLVCNIFPLVFFKYTGFFVTNINTIIGLFGAAPFTVPRFKLPVGLSFYTFQIITYCMDIYRRKAEAEKDPVKLGLFIAMFPKVLQGPIETYHHMAPQLADSRVSRTDFAEGVRRVIMGLGKKALIANVLSVPVDKIFAVPASDLTAGVAWLGAALYGLQLLFDWVAYCDIAIGLGKMFGFKFMENFNYPLVSRSVGEFWRRYHITLTAWFRDYLYIPLGGNRVSNARAYFNIIIIFFISGLWHGAAWSFVIWGMCHGIFMAFERATSNVTERSPFGHLYLLMFYFTSFVFFRANDLAAAGTYIATMYGVIHPAVARYDFIQFISNSDTIIGIILALVGSVPLAPFVRGKVEAFIDAQNGSTYRVLSIAFFTAQITFLACVLLLSAMALASDTYTPFIYRQF